MQLVLLIIDRIVKQVLEIINGIQVYEGFMVWLD